MSQFPLEPWELYLRSREIGRPVVVGPIMWRGVPTKMSVKFMHRGRREFWAIFCPLDTSTTNYITCYRDKEGLIRPMDFYEYQGFDAELAASSGANFPGRLFYVRGRPCIWNTERCSWLQVSELLPFRIPFRWNDEVASEGVFSWLQAQYQEDESEAKFALRWRESNTLHRLEFVSQRSPQVVELMRLLRWVLQCLPFDFGDACILRMEEESRCYLRYLREGDRTFTDLFEIQDQPPFLVAWNTFLFRHFYLLPPLDENLPLCVLDWFLPNIKRVCVQVMKPSYHERVEAALLLREWLEGKASAEEIERLLSNEK